MKQYHLSIAALVALGAAGFGGAATAVPITAGLVVSQADGPVHVQYDSYSWREERLRNRDAWREDRLRNRDAWRAERLRERDAWRADRWRERNAWREWREERSRSYGWW